MTASAFEASDSRSRLFFKHQRKEEDYELRPQWKTAITSEHGKIGATYVQKLIEAGLYRDLVEERKY